MEAEELSTLAEYPRTFYRYRPSSSDYFLEEVKRAMRGEHFFVSLAQMNDPFDCNPSYVGSSAGEIYQFLRSIGRTHLVQEDSAKERLPPGKLGKKLLKKDFSLTYPNVARMLPVFHDRHKRIRKSARIICLSETWHNPLMWAH